MTRKGGLWIAASIEKYVRAFNLFGSAEQLGVRKRST